ncbi:hypothetical protein J3459_017446 [Metarhizium acridum]|nr:hypothetical protein J3459_017446 [Metarhizium acridum]
MMARLKKPAKDSVSANSTKENAPTNGAKSNRKNGDPARSDRNGSRGSRIAEKDTKTAATSASGRCCFLATPEIAIKEEQEEARCYQACSGSRKRAPR